MNANEYEIMAHAEGRHWWWRARRDIVATVIRNYAPLGKNRELSVGEIGCGTGGNLPVLAQFGHVTGAEASDIAVSRLRRKFGDSFDIRKHAIPEDLPITFDILCCLDVLEHISDDAEAMEWIAGHLTTGGIAVVTVPALDMLWSGQDEAARHYRRYTRDSLLRLVPPDVEVLHVTYFNTILFPVIALVRAAMRWTRSTGSVPRSHLGVPPNVVNLVLFWLFRLERHIVCTGRSPLGVSLLLVLRRRHLLASTRPT